MLTLFLYQYHLDNIHTWQHFLLYTDEIDHNGAEDEPVQEHDGFEAAVPKECADNTEDKVDGADSGSVGVVLSDDFEVLLQKYFSKISFTDIYYFSRLTSQ